MAYHLTSTGIDTDAGVFYQSSSTGAYGGNGVTQLSFTLPTDVRFAEVWCLGKQAHTWGSDCFFHAVCWMSYGSNWYMKEFRNTVSTIQGNWQGVLGSINSSGVITIVNRSSMSYNHSAYSCVRYMATA